VVESEPGEDKENIIRRESVKKVKKLLFWKNHAHTSKALKISHIFVQKRKLR
jgi:hypothetical protein